MNPRLRRISLSIGTDVLAAIDTARGTMERGAWMSSACFSVACGQFLRLPRHLSDAIGDDAARLGITRDERASEVVSAGLGILGRKLSKEGT